ncbi:DNA invertase Pin-like site-specific DNA recombinase [Geomicrobium halophilum]|uniref:DNA invertase Pin-like site-specific DNA recombinase n=1 Tax=Geomicrobium halophilum TaxID=549000 RepID=A0A841PN80_9BACL|nr:recombinase family protein [Geomicrobium halophilum]MBB6450307.1 DNA invertase Pin-like site-specific DNA recombinase [Geomicrobium halophilum]
MVKLAYTRVVSEHQSAQDQVQQMEAMEVDEFYHEHASGVSQSYPEREQLLQNIEAGDELHVTELPKIIRSIEDLLDVILHLREKDALLYSLEESWLDFSDRNPYNEYFLSIVERLQQLSTDIRQMRRQEGVEAAKHEGKYQGRKKTYDTDHPGMNHAIELYREGHHTVKQICEITQISRSSLYRELKRRD